MIYVSEEREKWDRYYASLPLVEEDELAKECYAEFVLRVQELLPQGGMVLEAGCGAGWQSLALARTGKFQIRLMDFSREAIRYAQRLFEREGLAAEIVLDDVFKAGKPEFDLVFNSGVMEHYSFDQQVEFLRGMASRSRKYVVVLVPNRLCYWYWLWRVQAASRGQWPYGREVPLVDLSPIFAAAGLRFLGQAFFGQTWTESFISSLSGMDEALRQMILDIHRSPLVPMSVKSYLVGALGCVTSERVALPPVWASAPLGEDPETAQLRAALADALSLRVGGDHLRRQLEELLRQKEQEVEELLLQIRERNQLIHQLSSALRLHSSGL